MTVETNAGAHGLQQREGKGGPWTPLGFHTWYRSSVATRWYASLSIH